MAVDLNDILSNSIYGVEMEGEAIDLTAFSLALAVCDSLSPPDIWNNLRLDKLRNRNLREGDFFAPETVASTAESPWPQKFSVIVGNPPFESKLTSAAQAVASARPKEVPALPDRQIAYLFLEQCLQLLDQDAALCLLQPHGLLYNNNPIEFWRHLCSLAQPKTVLDFVSVRNLYDGANKETIAWHAENTQTSNNTILHKVFRQAYSTAEGFAFELDHYDLHYVPLILAMQDQYVWRAGLLGGGRLYEMGNRLRKIRTLADVVAANGWVYGEGYIDANGNNDGGFLKGMPMVPAKGFNEKGIDRSRLSKVVKTRFHRPRQPDLYQPPLILIKETSSLPTVFWEEGPLAFNDCIVGIHSDPTQRDCLHNLYQYLSTQSQFLRFSCALSGSKALAGRATAIAKRDIDRLPVPESLSAVQLSYWEEILMEDTLEFMIEYVLKGNDPRALKSGADDTRIQKYAKAFVRLMGSLYKNFYQADHIRLDGLIAQPFYFGNTPEVSWLGDDTQEALRRLIYENTSQSLRTVRVVRYYEKNVVLVVKPDRLRYWIESTAIRDADDTLIDLEDQGW